MTKKQEPVYVNEADYTPGEVHQPKIQSSLNFLGYTRAQWTGTNGKINTTDKIYIDFIASYQYNDEQLVYAEYEFKEVLPKTRAMP